MKIKPIHLDTLVAAMTTHADQIKGFIQPYKQQGFSEIRFLWDAFRLLRINGDSTRWLCDNLYAYMNDDHMTTALRAAAKQAGIVYG